VVLSNTNLSSCIPLGENYKQVSTIMLTSSITRNSVCGIKNEIPIVKPCEAMPNQDFGNGYKIIKGQVAHLASRSAKSTEAQMPQCSLLQDPAWTTH